MYAKTMKWYGERRMNKILRKFKGKSFANSKKIRTFANDDEPTALANSGNKGIPTLRGESARRFLERAAKVEAEAKKRMNEPPTLDGLERELTFQKFFLESDKRQVEERENKIKELEAKIKELKNGKTEEK